MPLAIGLGCGIPFGGQAPFDPRNLTGFLAAYDLTGRMGNLWQDLARTTSATAATNPVAVADEWTGSTSRRLVNSAAATRPLIAASNDGVTMDGVDDFLWASAFAGGTVANCYVAMRWALAGVPPASNGRIVSFASGGADFSTAFTWYLKVGNAASLDTIVPSATSSAEADLYAGSTAYGTFIDAEFCITGSGNSELFIGGVSQGTTAKNATAMGLASFGLGVNANGAGAAFANLTTRRLVIATTIPDAVTRASVRTWLTQ